MVKKNGKIFGVIGDPISHSKSPVMHNAALKHLGINAKYKAFLVKENELLSFLKKIRTQKISGINVTIPHKQKIIPYLDKLTSQAKKINAVNTVYLKGNQLIGHNTDGLGYLKSLKQETKIKLKDAHVVVLGSGGASLAICHTLCEQKIKSLTILNRNPKQAKPLLDDLQAHYPKIKFGRGNLNKISTKVLKNCDLIINTTSLGMPQNPWLSLSFLKYLKKTAIVSDIVYNPKETDFLRQAKDLNHPIHYGTGMLLQQGALAFEIFTGKKAPVEIMREALLKSLKT